MSKNKTQQDNLDVGVGAAPGQYLGYGLQPLRVCARLLTASNGDSVSTEYLDDVALHRANGLLLLEQNKSALSQNPVSDWATELWKTFANWFATTTKLNLDAANTEYVLYVAPVKTGSRVNALHEARSAEHVEEIVRSLQADIDSRESPPACAEYVKVFLDADPSLRASIVTNFSLVGHDSPIDEIRNQLAASVSPAVLEDICSAAIGWVKKTIDEQLRANEIAKIAVSDFQVRLRAIIKRQDRDHVLNSFASVPCGVAIDAEVRRRVYIRQMEIIECESDEKLRAASDFLLASAEDRKSVV